MPSAVSFQVFNSLEFVAMLSLPLKGPFYEGTEFSRRCLNVLKGTHLAALIRVQPRVSSVVPKL